MSWLCLCQEVEGELTDFISRESISSKYRYALKKKKKKKNHSYRHCPSLDEGLLKIMDSLKTDVLFRWKQVVCKEEECDAIKLRWWRVLGVRGQRKISSPTLYLKEVDREETEIIKTP